MNNQEICSISKSISKIPTSDALSSYHKLSLSVVTKHAPSKQITARLNLNVSLIKSSKSKVTPFSGTCTRRNTIEFSPKNSRDSLAIKEPLKTNKASLQKKFDFNLKSEPIQPSRIPRIRWEEQKLPVTPTEVLARFSDFLPI